MIQRLKCKSISPCRDLRSMSPKSRDCPNYSTRKSASWQKAHFEWVPPESTARGIFQFILHMSSVVSGGASTVHKTSLGTVDRFPLSFMHS
jgi:hypothetical protein